MLMMCWLYCVPLLKWLFFVSSPLLIVFSLFVLKRGVYQHRLKLRQLSFLYMFLSVFKIGTIDLYFLRDKILCGSAFFETGCNITGFKMLQVAGLAFFVLSSFVLFKIYTGFIRERKPEYKTAKQASLRLWANSSMILVVFMIGWLLTPWVGYLTIGTVPEFFLTSSWEFLALFNLVFLLIGFWKNESCNKPREVKKTRKYTEKAWVPIDTLWMASILLLIASGFFYVSDDVLSKPGVKNSGYITSSVG